MKTSQLRRRRKEGSEGERSLTERSTVGVDVDDEGQRQDDDDNGHDVDEAKLLEEQLHLATLFNQLRLERLGS